MNLFKNVFFSQINTKWENKTIKTAKDQTKRLEKHQEIRGYKIFYMLNSTEHDICLAHSINISRNSAFSVTDKPRMLFSLLINVTMPMIFGILTFKSRKNFMLS